VTFLRWYHQQVGGLYIILGQKGNNFKHKDENSTHNSWGNILFGRFLVHHQGALATPQTHLASAPSTLRSKIFMLVYINYWVIALLCFAHTVQLPISLCVPSFTHLQLCRFREASTPLKSRPSTMTPLSSYSPPSHQDLFARKSRISWRTLSLILLIQTFSKAKVKEKGRKIDVIIRKNLWPYTCFVWTVN
jgi:hypothetical protein